MLHAVTADSLTHLADSTLWTADGACGIQAHLTTPGGSGYPVYWQGKRKKLTLKQQPNKHLKKLLDDEGKKVLARRGKKKTVKVEPIKLWP